MAQLMMKQGRAGVRVHRTFFTIDVTCPYTRRDWEVVRGGRRSTSPEEGSHCKHSQMMKDSGTTCNI